MTPILISLAAASGVYLLVTRPAGPSLRVRARRWTNRLAGRVDGWLAQVGLGAVDRRTFAAVVAALFGGGALLGHAVFGGIAPAVLLGGATGAVPVAGHRARRDRLRREAHEAWPRLIEEIRVQTGSLGRSVPQSLFAAGRTAPEELRSAFAAAQREWLLTTDLDRTMTILKAHLADPTADMVCETLVVAHEVGGTDLDQRLEALAADRFDDVQGRKDAHARLASARFARAFVVLVPAGMAVAGMSIGNGRDAYRSGAGQSLVVVALVVVAACWVWSGRIMRLPEPQRVFGE